MTKGLGPMVNIQRRDIQKKEFKMKVKELIEKLKEFDQELEIKLVDDFCDDCIDIDYITIDCDSKKGFVRLG
jgi:hypothetical protein